MTIHNSHIREAGRVVLFPFYGGKKFKFKETTGLIWSETSKNKRAKSYDWDIAAFLKSWISKPLSQLQV